LRFGYFLGIENTMCSITDTTNKIRDLLFGSDSKKKLVDIRQPITLQTYFNKAYKEALVAKRLGDQPPDDLTKKLHVPISIIAHADTGNGHQSAGAHQDEMHFSASLLKVAAMFAAFNLRAEAKALAQAPPPGGFANQTAFFAALKLKFHSGDAVLAIRNAGAGVGLEPRYADILNVTGFGGSGGLTVKFVPAFYHSLTEDRALYQAYEDIRTADGLGEDIHHNKIENARSLAALAKVSHMYRMIVWSDNISAGECIRRLGYAYINVKLMEAKLFDRETGTGIWVGGDFAGGIRVEVDSVNDGKVALATTSRQIARLFSLIQLGTLVDADSSAGMKELIQQAQRNEPSWLTRDPGPRLFTVDSVKIGVANLKPNLPPLGPKVYSEGIIITWDTDALLPDEKTPKDRHLNGEIAVCWQNLQQDTIASDFEGVAEVIQNTIQNFLNQTPI
jgi:hypothetical protein